MERWHNIVTILELKIIYLIIRAQCADCTWYIVVIVSMNSFEPNFPDDERHVKKCSLSVRRLKARAHSRILKKCLVSFKGEIWLGGGGQMAIIRPVIVARSVQAVNSRGYRTVNGPTVDEGWAWGDGLDAGTREKETSWRAIPCESPDATLLGAIRRGGNENKW